jgi:predicted permease
MSGPTPTLFTTLGARPILGRLPVAEDEDRAAVISHRLWTSWFGGDPSVLNRSYFMAGGQRTIVGVMGPEFRFPTDDTLAWLSAPIDPDGIEPGQFFFPLVGRMAPGATLDALASELNVLARRLPARFGGSANYARLIEQHRAVVRPLDDAILGDVKRPLWVLLAACGIVLVIACANVANLFMVRDEGRQRDLAVRRAIGATRAQLVRVQMSEAIVVAALAGALALVIASAALPVFLGGAPDGIPRLGDVRITGATLLFTLAAAVIAALACGAVPALRASSGSYARLRDGSRGATRGPRRGRDALVVAQTALALVLLIGSGLLMRSFWALRAVDPGYDTTDVFTFQIAPQRPSLSDGPSWARFQLDFMARLRALPGVQLVGLVENVPLNEGTASARFHRDGIVGEPDSGPLLQFTFAAGDYFKAMGIEVLEGRPFDLADHLRASGHVIVSRSAAAALWPGQSAIGKRLQRQQQSSGGGSGISATDAWDTVIGVVEDVLQYNFRDTPDPLVYYPLVGPDPQSWAITSPAYVVKTPRAGTIAADVRALAREVAPEAPMYRVYTMAELAGGSMVDVSFTMLTLGVASLLALILGAAGLYGVLSFIVAERTREIGVRMALGAQAAQVLRMVLAQGTRVVAAGVVLGLAAAFWASEALGSLLFGVTAADPATFAAMAAGMVAVGLLASFVPARRASRVDPIVSLRAE